MMKPIYLIFIMLLCGSFLSLGQQSCGVFNTAEDYKSHRISVQGDCLFGKNAIQVSDFFLRPYIYIKTENEKIKIHQDSIYAIQNCKGEMYRIYKQEAFLLVDTGVLNIYSHSYIGKIVIRTSKGIKYKDKKMTDYYFSVDDSAVIVPLTVTNVRLSLLINKDLDRIILQQFSNNKPLWVKSDDSCNINAFLLKCNVK